MLKKRLKCVAIVIATALFCACGGYASSGKTSDSGSTDKLSQHKTESYAQDIGTFTAPEFSESVFNAEAATGKNGVLIDISSVSKGYVGVSALSDKRLKFKVIKDGVSCIFDLLGDGTPTIFPLAMGSGSYTLQAMQNTSASRYVEICVIASDVQLESEFAPFLRPNQFTNYSKTSECVKKASELVKTAKTDVEAAAKIYAYIKDNIIYDKVKAEDLKTTYLPVPDETLATNKGICFDFASLAAAMLRSQGIPTKIVEGKVAPDDIQHAWNMIWLEEKGWITAKLEVSAKNWERIDITFAAGGAATDFIGDGTNYTEMFAY